MLAETFLVSSHGKKPGSNGRVFSGVRTSHTGLRAEIPAQTQSFQHWQTDRCTSSMMCPDHLSIASLCSAGAKKAFESKPLLALISRLGES
jgi:hypothetical protein